MSYIKGLINQLLSEKQMLAKPKYKNLTNNFSFQKVRRIVLNKKFINLKINII